MNKINKKLKQIFSMFAASVLLFSCGNLYIENQVPSEEVYTLEETEENKIIENKKDKSVTIIGRLTSPTGAVPENMARSALPSVALGSYTYELSADNGTKTADGTVDTSDMTYTITLYDGDDYVLTVTAYSDAGKTTKVLSGTTTITVADGTVTSGSTSICLNPLTNSGATGTVNLPVKVAADSGITKVTVEWADKFAIMEIDATASTPVLSGNITMTTQDGGGNWVNPDCGTYPVTFKFYTGENLAYSFVETVSVYENLETNKWLNNTGAPYIASGEIFITKALVQSYALKTFYVDPVNGSDSESGDFFFPVSSVQRAVNMIEAVNDGVSEYSIILNGDFTADDSMTFQQGGLNEYNVVCIDPSSDLKLKIKSNKTAQKRKIDAAASASSERRGIYVGAKADVELENLIISNGYVDAKNGGGIFLDGKLTINTCEISHNTVTGGSNYYGGGIYISPSGILIADTIDVNNNVSSGGAGIQSKGTSTISNSFISSNVCNAWGGGLRINGGKTEAFNTEIYDNSANYGAGIEHVFGEVLLSDCNIHDNTITSADTYAGADIILCADSESKTFTITKNTIVKGIISTRTEAIKNYKKLVVQDLTGSADTQIFKINVQNGASGDLVVYGMNGYEDRFKVYSGDGLSELEDYAIDSAGKLQFTGMALGGNLVHTLVLNNDITFAASTTTVSKAAGGAITITSSINSNPVANVFSTYEGFKVEVLSYGVQTGVENDPDLAKVVIPSGCDWPAGKYELYITGKYQGVEYNASIYFDLTE